VKKYCDRVYKDGFHESLDIRLHDRLIFNYFMAVSFPAHKEIDGERVCTKSESIKQQESHCCKLVKDLENAFGDIHYEYCTPETDDEPILNKYCRDSCFFLYSLLGESRRKCFLEHSGIK
jgi:hypothetical protein